MPAIIVKRGKVWLVVSHAGPGARTLGRHKTRKAALAQQRAVNMALRKRGKDG